MVVDSYGVLYNYNIFVAMLKPFGFVSISAKKYTFLSMHVLKIRFFLLPYLYIYVYTWFDSKVGVRTKQKYIRISNSLYLNDILCLFCVFSGGVTCGTDRHAACGIVHICSNPAERSRTCTELLSNFPSNHTLQCGQQRSRWAHWTFFVLLFQHDTEHRRTFNRLYKALYHS